MKRVGHKTDVWNSSYNSKIFSLLFLLAGCFSWATKEVGSKYSPLTFFYSSHAPFELGENVLGCIQSSPYFFIKAEHSSEEMIFSQNHASAITILPLKLYIEQRNHISYVGYVKAASSQSVIIASYIYPLNPSMRIGFSSPDDILGFGAPFLWFQKQGWSPKESVFTGSYLKNLELLEDHKIDSAVLPDSFIQENKLPKGILTTSVVLDIPLGVLVATSQLPIQYYQGIRDIFSQCTLEFKVYSEPLSADLDKIFL
jgi:hypothetical protein